MPPARATPAPPRAERLFMKMKPELRARCERIREDLAAAGTEDVKVRYRLGALVTDIEAEPDKYGKRGVQQLAAALGYDKTSLYRHAKVAQCWSAKELADLQRRKGVTGLPVSFSHLQLLATVSSEKKREQYLEAVLEQGLSVRELKRLLRPRDELAPTEAPGTSAPVRVLRELRATAGKWKEGLAALENELVPAIGSGPPPPELRAKYRRALAEQKEFARRLRKLREQLRVWLRSPTEASQADADT